MKPVTIVGAGFSGLTLAYYLVKAGMKVQIIERKTVAGGLLNTHPTAFGLVETAANGILADDEVLSMWSDLNLTQAAHHSDRKKRFIYWNRPSRWPVSVTTTFKLIAFVLRKIFRPTSVKPFDGETINSWAARQVDREFGERLLNPALQGIYAGDPQKMSASVVMAGFLKGGKRGKTSAPLQGMGSWMQSLRTYLEGQGTQFVFDREFELENGHSGPTVIATGIAAAVKVIEATKPQLAQKLARCETLPLISTTMFFEPHPKDLKGFGVLFPRLQGFSSLGVLFNASIFKDRSPLRSETWILGGAGGETLLNLSDAELIRMILKDRQRLTEREEEAPTLVQISRWPKALPHYTVEWEAALRELTPEPPLFLHGNYLGQLGLSGILGRSRSLAHEIARRYGA